MSAVLVEAGPDKGAIWHFGEPNKEQKELAAGNAWADLSHRGVLSQLQVKIDLLGCTH